MLTITDKAREMLEQFISQADGGDDLAVRIEIIGRGPKGFQYDLQLIENKDSKDDDIQINSSDFDVIIAQRSVQYIDGTTLDFKETLMGGGFSFDNPNPLWVDELSQSVAEIIEYISTFTTLDPGDVIATGTPGGVGSKREPPVFMKSGDTVEVIVERVGHLINDVVEESVS